MNNNGAQDLTAISRSNSVVSSDRHLAALVDSIAEQIRSGKSCDIDELARLHPECADELGALIPAVRTLVDLGSSVCWQPSSTDLPAEQPCSGTLGDFEIIREIGRGGMGVVYEAEQASVGRRVALKVLPFAAMLKSQQLERFRNEVRAAGSLNHPHIVAVHAVGNERGMHFYAMQLIVGHSLAEVIKEMRQYAGAEDGRTKSRERRSEGNESIVDPLSSSPQPLAARSSVDTVPKGQLSTLRTTQPNKFYQTVAKLGQQAAEALDHAHSRGVIHRDVKPANLLVGSEEHLWIADFGLARLEADAGMTMSGDLLGTLRYMSPEQAAGDRAVIDYRTDIYSLGATLYELLALRPAFTSDDRQQLLHDLASTSPTPLSKLDARIPVDLETIISKAMEKDLEDRYASAAELATDLGNFIEHRPIAARAPSLASRVRKWARRRPKMVAAAFAVLMLATVGLGLSTALIAAANHRTAERQTQAEQNLLIAAETIDKLLARVGEDAHAHGQLRHADELLRDAVASYDQLLAESDDPQLVLKAASAYEQLSGVLRLGAEFDESHRVAEQGLKLFRRLPDNVAVSDEALTIRASLLGASGMAKLNVHDYATADWSLRECLGLREQLCASKPDDVPCRKGLLLAHNNLGALLMSAGQLEEAEKELRAADALRQTLPTKEQNRPLGLNEQAGLKTNLAMIAVKRGDYVAAETDFHTAIDVQRRAVAGLPEDPSMREDLYKFRWNLADVLVRAGRHAAAADEIVTVSEEFPERLQAQVEGVWLLVRCIEATKSTPPLSQQGVQGGGRDVEQVLKHYHALAQKLIDRSKSSTFAPPAVQQELAWLLATCPVRELRDGRRALQIAQRLCEADSKLDENQHALAAAHLELGNYAHAHASADIAIGYDGHGGDVYEFALLALAEAGQDHMENANRWRKKALAAHNAMGEHTDEGLRTLVAELKRLPFQGGDS